MHTQSLRGYHNTSLFPSPQVSLFDIPFLGAPKRWSVSSFTCWSRTWLGIGPGALPDLVAVPGEFVCPANESGQGMAIRRVRAPVWKRTQNTIRWYASSFILGLLHSDPAEPLFQRLKGPAWLEFCWSLQKMLQKPVLEKPSTTLRELENSGLL